MLFFDKFPKISYDVAKDGYTKPVIFTNILFRIKILDAIKNNVYSYYDIIVPESDTIEVFAEKYYGNPEYHWIIAMANDMTDPLFDWPKTYLQFQNYINSKYGSLANAKSQIKSYLLTITRKDSLTGTTDTNVLELDETTYNSTPVYSLDTFNLSSGSTLTEEKRTSTLSAYDYEVAENEKKRTIKVIKKDYLSQILSEFNTITGQATGLRTIS